MRDWLSSNEQSFTELGIVWTENLDDPVNIEDYGWDEAECADLLDLIHAYLAAKEAFMNDNSTANRVAKDNAKNKAMQGMREFANTFVRFNRKMDAAARQVMGIRPRDPSPTVHPRPTSRPKTIVQNTKNRMEHKVKAVGPEGSGAGKPADAYGVKFAWTVGGVKPAAAEELVKSKFSRKVSLIVTYTEHDKGKPVWYATCYENARGEAGPWSLLEEAFIG